MREKIEKALEKFVSWVLFTEIGQCIVFHTIPLIVMVVALSFVNPIFIYIFGGAVLMTIPIVLTFAFISK